MGTLRELLKVQPEVEGRLPVKFKAKWIAALTNGSYAQTDGVLFRAKAGEEDDGDIHPAGYCCLGVAAKVCEVGNLTLEGRGFLNNIDPTAQLRIPKLLKDRRLQEQLSTFNDDKKYTFKQIGRWVEKHL